MPSSAVDLARHAEQRDEPGNALAAIVTLRDRLDELEDFHVENARRLGWSWGEIAQPLGISRQAVHHKHARRVPDARRRGRAGRVTAAVVRDWVARAGREAAALGHGSLGTDHLLLALVEDESAGLLEQLAVTPEQIRRAVVERRGSRRSRPTSPPELESDATAALDGVLREATRASERGVAVEQVLLALLSDGESAAAQVLATLGVSTEDVERRVVGAR